jgi:hypothetical protein
VLRRVVKAAGRDWQLAEAATGPLIGLGVGAARLTHKRSITTDYPGETTFALTGSWATQFVSSGSPSLARWICCPRLASTQCCSSAAVHGGLVATRSYIHLATRHFPKCD